MITIRTVTMSKRLPPVCALDRPRQVTALTDAGARSGLGLTPGLMKVERAADGKLWGRD